jgi:hypothetical protein
MYFRVFFPRLFPCLHRGLSRSCTSRRSPRPFFVRCQLSYAFDRLAIFVPPLGVFLERGCGADFVCSFFFLMQSRREISRRV